MDVDAKNLRAWRFGDILAYDFTGHGFPDPAMRAMFIFPYYWGNTFSSLNLRGFDPSREDLVETRRADKWIRIEKAP